MLKSELRQHHLAKRNALAPKLRQIWSSQISQQITNLCHTMTPKSVGLYSSYKSEVETFPLFSFFRSKNVICAFPKTSDAGLDYKVVNDLSQLDEKVRGISEPNSLLPSIKPEWLFVPGIAFSKKGDRIGFGYGHFDKTLLQYPTAKYIALAYEAQIIEADYLPDPWDVKMHLVVTNDNVYGSW